jgi:two-component system, LytTR family, response regulator
MYTAIIVDDEEQNRVVLSRLLEQFCHDVKVVASVSSVKAAKVSIEEHLPNIVFLDIEMPEENGFKLLEDLNQANFEVIFTTAHANYAIKAIKFAALDYLLKPININELKIAVEKAITNINNKNAQKLISQLPNKKIRFFTKNKDREKEGFEFKKIALPTLDGIDFYNVNDILQCEAERAYCNFYLTNGKKILVSKPLSEYEEILEECNFFRVHKSSMVNLNHIKKYVKGKGGYVIMSDDSTVNVSVRKKDYLMEVLAGQS